MKVTGVAGRRLLSLRSLYFDELIEFDINSYSEEGVAFAKLFEEAFANFLGLSQPQQFIRISKILLSFSQQSKESPGLMKNVFSSLTPRVSGTLLLTNKQ